MDTMVVDEYALHLEISLLALRLLFVFDEGVLQTFACAFVTDDLAGKDLAKATENELEILIYRVSAADDDYSIASMRCPAFDEISHTGCYRIELAYEQNILRWFDFCERQISHHLQCQGLGSRLPLSPQLLHSLGICIF